MVFNEGSNALGERIAADISRKKAPGENSIVVTRGMRVGFSGHCWDWNAQECIFEPRHSSNCALAKVIIRTIDAHPEVETKGSCRRRVVFCTREREKFSFLITS